MDAVWDGRSDGSMDEAGSWVWDRSTGWDSFWGELGALHCNQWRVCSIAGQKLREPTRPVSKLFCAIL